MILYDKWYMLTAIDLMFEPKRHNSRYCSKQAEEELEEGAEVHCGAGGRAHVT